MQRTIKQKTAATRAARPYATPRRRGAAAVLAMMFLILFSALAVGFYSTTNVGVQIAGNEQRGSKSLLAAESGMQFMKYHLATLGVPPNTPANELFVRIHERLGVKLDNYPLMPAGGRTVGINADQTVIRIPSGEDKWIDLDGQGAQFRVVITKLLAGEEVEVMVFGRCGTSGEVAGAKGLKLHYANLPNPAAIFNYGVASKSKITMNGNVTIRGTTGFAHMGSVLSAHSATNVPLIMTGSPEISGHVSFTHPNPVPSISSTATIADLHPGDAGFDDVVHDNVPEPEFPRVQTAAFEQYVPAATVLTGPRVITTSNPTGTFFKNIRIKAGANPTFNSGTTIQGVIFVESPNEVKFNGGARIEGMIVVKTDDNNNETLDPAQNIIEFKGGVTFATLPAPTTTNAADFPASLRSLTGSAVLAPGFNLKFGGNFNAINGTLVASQMAFSGTAGGIIKGSVINLKDTGVSLAGTSDIIIESQGTSNHPAGIFFGSHYEPLPYTYEEVAQ
jgi:hypothetical protein